MERLKEVTEGIWVAEGDHYMPGRVYFPVRTTIVRLEDGGLWVHSPIALTEALAAEVEALGPVRALVAPNKLHHMYFGAWAARFPEARRYGAPGLAAKRPDLALEEVLGDEAPRAWAGGFDQLVIRGVPEVEEVVFLHRASATLIMTDLVFNRHGDMRNPQTWLVMTMAGARNRLMQSRLWRVLTRDRAAAGASVAAMMAWDFDRLIMAHGQIIDEGARQRLPEALWWMLAGLPQALPARA